MVLEFSVNWLAIIISAIVGFVVSWLWWGPLFGETWMKYSGVKPTKDMKKGMGSKMLIAFIANLVMAYVLAALILSVGVTTMGTALSLAFWAWLGFVATIGVGIVLWNGKPWGLFWLNNIGWLVTLLFMATVLVTVG